MSLFGGRQGKQSTSSNQPSLGWGRPGASASARNRDERESLIPASTSGDDFDDSDAISLLSNIADRDSRRGGSAARRRARARARAQGRTCGTFWLDLEQLIPSMSCGLLGRRKNNDEESGRQRAASIGSVMSRGRRSHAGGDELATSRHSRSLSDASTDSAGSLAGSGFAESVDADAGMLDDRDIARFGQPSASSTVADEAHPSAVTSTLKATTEQEAKAKAQAAAAEAEAQAERQKALEAEAPDYNKKPKPKRSVKGKKRRDLQQKRKRPSPKRAAKPSAKLPKRDCSSYSRRRRRLSDGGPRLRRRLLREGSGWRMRKGTSRTIMMLSSTSTTRMRGTVWKRRCARATTNSTAMLKRVKTDTMRQFKSKDRVAWCIITTTTTLHRQPTRKRSRVPSVAPTSPIRRAR